MFNSTKRLVKKLSGHKRFYVDKSVDLEFFWKMNSLQDISILSIGISDKTYREFIVDFASFKAIYEYSLGKDIKPSDKMVETKNAPFLVSEYRTKNGDILIKNTRTKNYGASVLAKASESAIILKRVAYLDNERVLAVDVLALNLEASKKLVKVIKKSFKKVDIKLELEGENE